jgi:hypothetical protein
MHFRWLINRRVYFERIDYSIIKWSENAFPSDLDVQEAILVSVLLVEVPDVVGGFDDLVSYFYEEALFLVHFAYFAADVFHKHEH